MFVGVRHCVPALVAMGPAWDPKSLLFIPITTCKEAHVRHEAEIGTRMKRSSLLRHTTGWFNRISGRAIQKPSDRRHEITTLTRGLHKASPHDQRLCTIDNQIGQLNSILEVHGQK